MRSREGSCPAFRIGGLWDERKEKKNAIISEYRKGGCILEGKSIGLKVMCGLNRWMTEW